MLAVAAGGPGDSEGQVRFRAHFVDALGNPQVHEESSRFSRVQGAWIYRDALGKI